MTEHHPDASLLEMIERHDQLWSLWTPEAAESGAVADMMDECADLERIYAPGRPSPPRASPESSASSGSPSSTTPVA